MTPVSSATTVAELVVERPARARVFEELGIDYCCGGKRSLEDACRSRGLDPATVVAVLDAVESAGGDGGEDWSRASLGELSDHIVGVHHAYLRRELPRLAALLEKVERAHASERAELRDVRAAFAQLHAELVTHTEAEERELFPAVRRLESDGRLGETVRGELARYESEHAAAGALLERLSALTGGYDLTRALCNTHRASLDALRELEHDLHEHIHEENNVLFPRLLEKAGLAA